MGIPIYEKPHISWLRLTIHTSWDRESDTFPIEEHGRDRHDEMTLNWENWVTMGIRKWSFDI